MNYLESAEQKISIWKKQNKKMRHIYLKFKFKKQISSRENTLAKSSDHNFLVENGNAAKMLGRNPSARERLKSEDIY